MKLQNTHHKKAEITFRARIAQQHTGEQVHFSSEMNASEIQQEIKKRLIATEYDFTKLKDGNISFSPFLEIGAEYGVRSSVLSSKYKAEGVALDISAGSLEKCVYFSKQNQLKKTPQLICADAYSLPFADNSFNFVFCYQTLHHFPDPLPIVEEALRVLAPGGYFFFAEEPVRQIVNLRLFRRPTKSTGLYKMLRSLLILPFISDIGKTEVDWGILEESFSLDLWKKVLKTAPLIEATVSPLFGKKAIITSTSQNVSLQTHIALLLFGGGISALLKKPMSNKKASSSVQYRCPDCKKILKTLTHCLPCKRKFKLHESVRYLLPKALEKQLYEK